MPPDGPGSAERGEGDVRENPARTPEGTPTERITTSPQEVRENPGSSPSGEPTVAIREQPESEAPSRVTRDTAAKRGEAKPKKKGRLRFLKELPILVVIAFLLALLIKTFLVQAFYIPSASMEPTLEVGDRVLVKKFLATPHRGDIIVFENPHPGPEPHRNPFSAFFHWVVEGLGVSTPENEDFIKRVIGLPGETVSMRGGIVYIDGKPLDEPYLHGEKDTRPFGPRKVLPNHLFVMGDNRLNSNDSRFGLGQIPMDKVVGRAFVIIWPPSHIDWLST